MRKLLLFKFRSSLYNTQTLPPLKRKTMIICIASLIAILSLTVLIVTLKSKLPEISPPILYYQLVEGTIYPEADALPGTRSVGFGSCVDVSSRGDFVVLGGMEDDEYYVGAVWVHNFTDFTVKLTGGSSPAEQRLLGSSCSVSDSSQQKKILAVGARGEDSNRGKVYIFEDLLVDSEYFIRPNDSTSAGSAFGTSVSISGDGLTIAASAPGADTGVGRVFIYDRIASEDWNLTGELRPSAEDHPQSFGNTVHLSSDGLRLASSVHTRNTTMGGVEVFNRPDRLSEFTRSQVIQPPDSEDQKVGQYFSMSRDGLRLFLPSSVSGEEELGMVWVYEYSAADRKFMLDKALGPLNTTSIHYTSTTYNGDRFLTCSDGNNGCQLRTVYDKWAVVQTITPDVIPLDDVTLHKVTRSAFSDDGKKLVLSSISFNSTESGAWFFSSPL